MFANCQPWRLPVTACHTFENMKIESLSYRKKTLKLANQWTFNGHSNILLTGCLYF